MNKTRIKITTDCNSVSYQCQYYCGFFWWWQDMHLDLETLADFDTIKEAQRHIDQWIIRQAEYRAESVVKLNKKKSRKIIYVDYP
jgi:hypothetical protein